MNISDYKIYEIEYSYETPERYTDQDGVQLTGRTLSGTSIFRMIHPRWGIGTASDPKEDHDLLEKIFRNRTKYSSLSNVQILGITSKDINLFVRHN